MVYSSKEAPGLITDVLAFDEKVIADREKAITAMIKGYQAGLDYMKANPEESAIIIGKVLGVSGPEATEQMDGVYNIPLDEMAQIFEPSDSTMSFYGSGAVIADILVKNQQIPAAPDFGDTFDASFVDALNE